MTATPAPALLPDSPYAARWSAAEHHLEVAAYDDGVVLVTLSQPDRRNAMSDAMTAAWPELMEALRTDADVRAVVVTGAGRAFCSGGDISWIGGEPDALVPDLRARMLAFYRGWLSIRSLEVPTIAAVNGAAVGAGAALALACDIRYAAASARFSVPFSSLGLHPGMATTWLLPEVVGIAAARDLLLTGRMVDAEEMLRLGLVSSVSGDDEAQDLRDSGELTIPAGPADAADAERRYRVRFAANHRRALVLGLMVFAIPMLGFSYSDFRLFGASEPYVALVALRVFVGALGHDLKHISDCRWLRLGRIRRFCLLRRVAWQ